MSSKIVKTILFAPHMTPLAGIAGILGIDPATFKPIEAFTRPVARDQFQQITGLTQAIPLMKLEPEHVTEVTMTGTKLIDAVRASKLHDPELVTRLTELLVDAGNKLIDNNHVQHNGAGGQPQAHPQRGQVAGAGRL